MESKILHLDQELILSNLALNWDELDDVYFNFSKIEEKIQSDLKNKSLEKLLKIQEQSPTLDKSELFVPVFEYSSVAILNLPKGVYLLDLVIENIILN